MEKYSNLYLAQDVKKHIQRIDERGDGERSTTKKDILALEGICREMFEAGAYSEFVQEGDFVIDGQMLHNAGPFREEVLHLAYIELRGVASKRAEYITKVAQYAKEKHVQLFFDTKYVGLAIAKN